MTATIPNVTPPNAGPVGDAIAVAPSSHGRDGDGLRSWGADVGRTIRRFAVYVDKIPRGEQPPDLPVERPTPFERAINLNSANALSIMIPEPELVRADRIARRD